MSNVILTPNENQVGFYVDLREMLKENMMDAYNNGNWEQVKMIADTLLDLNAFADNEKLLTLSENNGMGCTIREYKTGD